MLSQVQMRLMNPDQSDLCSQVGHRAASPESVRWLLVLGTPRAKFCP
jgi:hypothetical protein